MIGEILNDRYKIASEIGDGGMATVYRAVDLTLQREVAIKILHPHLAKDKDLGQRFHQEAAIAARLDHPNVMKIYDYGTHSDKRSYIVAELIRGRDFHKWQVEHARVNGEPFPAVACAMVAEEALGGLAAAHAMNVVHRDVKPDNVMIAEDGAVKLMDFGIAKNTSTSLTMTGHFLGSPSYASPEQVKGENVDARSDLYSMGIILYEALTNRLPFTGLSAPEVMMKICTGKYTPVRQVRPSIPKELADLVTKALHVDARSRYGSAGEMLRELRSFLASCDVSSSRDGLKRYFADPERFLAEHPLPAARAKEAPRKVTEERELKETKPSPREGREGERRAERRDERREEREFAPARKAVGAPVTPRDQPDYKSPREIASELRERAALAGTQSLRDRGGAPGEGRDFRSTQVLRDQREQREQRDQPDRRDARETPVRDPQERRDPPLRRAQPVRDVSFRETVRRPGAQSEGLPVGLILLAVIAVGLFAAFVLNTRDRDERGPTDGRLAREEERRTPGVGARPQDPRADARPVRPRTPRRPQKEQAQETEQDPPPTAAEPTRVEASRPAEIPKPDMPATRPATRPVTRPVARPDLRLTRPRPRDANPPRVAAMETRPDARPDTRPDRLREAPKETKSQAARLSLQTVPGGVPVYLGSDLLGETSRDGTARAFDAKPGPALLRIPKQQIAGTRYEGVTRKVFVAAGGTTSLGVISLTPIRTLSVNIAGPGVIVRINGDPYVLRGKPVSINLPEGRVDIEAKASNGKTLRRTVDLKGDDLALNSSLE